MVPKIYGDLSALEFFYVTEFATLSDVLDVKLCDLALVNSNFQLDVGSFDSRFQF